MNARALLGSIEKRERMSVVALLVVAATALLVNALSAPRDRYGPDGETYELMGWEAAQADGLFDCDNFAHAYWSPGWVATIGAVYRVTGREPYWLRGLLVAVAIATAWLTYRLARRVVRPAAAIAAAALFLFSSLVFRYTVYYQYEVMLALLLAVCASLLVDHDRDAVRGLGWRAACAGAALGWAALISPRVLALLPLAAACIWMHGGGRAGGRRSIALSVGVLLVLAPWTWRNHRCYGEWIATTTNGGINLYIANNPHATGSYFLPPADQRPPHALTDSDAWRREAIAYVLQHPFQTLARSIVKAFMFWKPHYGDQVLVLIPFLVGWWRWWRRRPRPLSPAHAWILGAPLVATAVHMVFFVQVRYMIPVLPLVGVTAAAGIAGFTKTGATPSNSRI
jgi:hypothetical protein